MAAEPIELGSCLLAVLIGLAGCVSRGDAGLAAPPFDPRTDWRVVESLDEFLPMRPAGTNDRAQARLDRMLESFDPSLAWRSDLVGTRERDNPWSGWTLFDGQRRLVGLYGVAGTGVGGCLAALMQHQSPPSSNGGGAPQEEPGEFPDKDYGVRCGSISAIRSLIKLPLMSESKALQTSTLSAQRYGAMSGQGGRSGSGRGASNSLVISRNGVNKRGWTGVGILTFLRWKTD